VAVEIRPATPEDARAIAEVHVASWRWAYRDILPAAVLDGLSVEARADMWASVLAEARERSVVLVATDAGALVGFGSAGPSREPDAADATAELFTLYLLEAATGRGTGRALFAAVLEAVRDLGYERAVLWVLEANEPTRRFYEAAGWRDDAARDLYEIAGHAYPEVRYAIDL
jgi:L-amino acid N-acyltransferase YncA